MRLKDGSGGRRCEASPANSISSGLPSQAGGDREEGGRLGRIPVRLASNSPQHCDVPLRARVARRATRGAAGKRGLSPLPFVFCQEEEQESLRRNNFPVCVRTTSLYLSFPRKSKFILVPDPNPRSMTANSPRVPHVAPLGQETP